jgi:hypothetical protein
MRFWLLISTFLLVCAAVLYYASYGRLHNKIEPRLNITYQQAPTETPINVINAAPEENITPKIVAAGQCTDLPKKQDVHALYIKSTAKDCGSLNDNESVMDEAQSKDVVRCLQASIEKGQCSKVKAFLSLQGFEGITEMFVESNNCELTVHQWSTTEPSCGYTKVSCNKISDRFPFAICAQ